MTSLLNTDEPHKTAVVNLMVHDNRNKNNYFRGIIAYCQEALQTTHPEDHPNYERLVGIQ